MLKIIRGDLWDYHPENWCIITTNIGWNREGKNIMGTGVAKQAALRYPELPYWYGAKCQQFEENIGVEPYRGPDNTARLLMFPTKSLNEQAPHLSWQKDSTLKRIEQSLKNMMLNIDTMMVLLNSPVYMPPPGCGNGKLELEQVYPLLEKHMKDSPIEFNLVLQ